MVLHQFQLVQGKGPDVNAMFLGFFWPVTTNQDLQSIPPPINFPNKQANKVWIFCHYTQYLCVRVTMTIASLT